MDANQDNSYFGNGMFEFVKSNNDRDYYKSAHKAITTCELWNWLRNHEFEEGQGFMFANNVPEVKCINSEMYKDPINSGHSGSSYGYTMRQMEYIAKYGYNIFRLEYTSSKKKME